MRPVRLAQPLTHLTWGEPNRFRVGVKTRAVVARPQGLPLEAKIAKITAAPNTTVEIPLAIPASTESPAKPVSLSVNRAGTHFKCSVGPPVKVAFRDGMGILRLPLPASLKPGRSYQLLVANGWTSETRKGLPGPCTRPILVDVVDE